DGSLDFDVVVRRLVRLVVPRFADFSAIYVPEADGSIRVREMRHSMPEREELHRELERRYPNRFAHPEGIRYVLTTGEPALYREPTDEQLSANAEDEEHLRLLRALAVRSAVLDRLREHHLDIDGPHPISIALRTGRTQVVDEVTDELRREWSPDEAYLQDLLEWPARAAVVAPMRARGRTLGTLALASFSERV